MKKITQIITLKLIACLLAAFYAGSVSGAMLYVATDGLNVTPYSTWANAATNIQTALGAASDGDVVAVGAGCYVVSEPLIMSNGITLVSRYGAASTEINGGNTNRCLTIGHPDAVLEGFTITAGSASSGGGVLITNGLMHNCVVTGNYAQLFGGGVYIQNGGIVSHCVISSNRAPIDAGGCGGGVCMGSAISGGGRLVFSTVSENEASDGGGVYMFANTAVENCNIISNVAWDTIGGGVGSGGGVSCNGTNITVTDCRIINNVSQESGGGVYLSGHSGQKITGCVIYYNLTDNYGGGVYVNIITDNSAYMFENCTIVGNYATNTVLGGGGGVCSGVGTSSFQNSILYFNDAGIGGDNYHIMVSGIATGRNNCTTPALPGTDNIIGDPQFIELPAADLGLTNTSPCVDTGTNQDWMINAFDMDGNPRIVNSVVDMGAYERNPSGGQATYNGIIQQILRPNSDVSYTAPADVECDMSAVQLLWGGGITQNVAVLDGINSYSQVTNARSCTIQFTLTDVTAGDHMLMLRSWDAQSAMVSTSVFFTVAPQRQYFLAADCDGDSLADTVYYDDTIGWYVNFSSAQYPGYTFGPVAFYKTDYLPLTGDFDGDGLIDLSLYSDTNGWVFKLSSLGYVGETGPAAFHAETFKSPGSTAVAADFDGDAQTDLGLYSEVDGWQVKLSSQGYIGEIGPVTFQITGAAPLAADFDGDGLADLALYDITNGWYLKLSSQGYQGQLGPIAFIISGSETFYSTSGDFDGDGLADPTVVSQTGVWYVWMSGGGAYTRVGPYNIPAP
ncbi:choice-of-anchor Q domain-containing protein [Verrucomicrobiota bacterium]